MEGNSKIRKEESLCQSESKVKPGLPDYLRCLANQVMLLIIFLERRFLPHRITPATPGLVGVLLG